MTSALRLGQRVWVVADEGRAFGRLVSVYLSSFEASVGLVVRLEGRLAVVTCLSKRQGTEWDFATDSAEDC